MKFEIVIILVKQLSKSLFPISYMNIGQTVCNTDSSIRLWYTLLPLSCYFYHRSSKTRVTKCTRVELNYLYVSCYLTIYVRSAQFELGNNINPMLTNNYLFSPRPSDPSGIKQIPEIEKFILVWRQPNKTQAEKKSKDERPELWIIITTV